VNSVTAEVITSVMESTPSPMRANDPLMKPTIIFSSERKRFPTIPMIELVFMILRR
jgi:hypothetical protein